MWRYEDMEGHSATSLWCCDIVEDIVNIVECREDMEDHYATSLWCRDIVNSKKYTYSVNL